MLNSAMLSHVRGHLRLEQRGSGPRSGLRMEMESPRVEIPTLKLLFLEEGRELFFTSRILYGRTRRDSTTKL